MARSRWLPGRLRPVVAWLQSLPDLVLYLGVAAIVGGIGLVAWGWGRVAALGDVGLQLPYVASACFTGAALVICGVGLVLIGARARDIDARREQVDELASLLRLVREALERRGEDEGPPLPNGRARIDDRARR